MIESENSIRSPYPYDCGLCCVILGNTCIANINTIDPAIKKYCSAKCIKMIHVNQGYTKCSVAVVDENSIITSDHGISDVLSRAGYDVLTISDGFIRLKGYDTGFIGGCCGYIDNNTLAFWGDINNHPDHLIIKDYLSKKGKKYINISDTEELTDYGSLIPLKQ